MIRRSNAILGALAVAILAVLALIGMRREASGRALCINEFIANSSIVYEGADGESGEWIELYNGSGERIDLTGYGLSDDPDEPYKYTFGTVYMDPGGFLLVGTDAEDAERYGTDIMTFRLSSRGGCVVLTSREGETIDYFEYQTCYNEIPYGRAYDGGPLALLNKATPGYSNSGSLVSRYVTDTVNKEKPEFSQPGGFYDEPFYLSIDHPAGTSVYYTTDGSIPNFTSNQYVEPIYIQDVSSLPNRYANISTTYNRNPLLEYGGLPVKKGVTIRARICRDGYFSEYTQDATYFVGMKPELTTVSLITDPDNLFGYENGIYVSGVLGKYSVLTKYDEQTAGHNYLGNYSVRGKETTRPVHVEIFSASNGYTGGGQSAEFRLNGGPTGSSQPCKPLRLYATSKYGDANVFDVDFTYGDDRPTDTRQIVLRTKRNFVTGALQDVVASVLFLNDNLYTQEYEPVALYIDGEYWGIAALRERVTQRGIAMRFGIDDKEMALVKYNDRNIDLVSGEEQDLADYLELQDYSLSHDMTLEESYRFVADRIDLDSFIRQQLIHIFFANCDWPDNNIRAFRSKYIDPENPYADGKWRYVLYDLDNSCMDAGHNTLLYAMGLIEERAGGWTYPYALPVWSTALFSGLMENPTFRAQYLKVYLEYREKIFQPNYLNAVLDRILDDYGSEFEGHIRRWSETPILLGKVLGLDGQSPSCDEYMAEMRDFFDKRLSNMDAFMEDFYAEKGDVIEWESASLNRREDEPDANESFQ